MKKHILALCLLAALLLTACGHGTPPTPTDDPGTDENAAVSPAGNDDIREADYTVADEELGNMKLIAYRDGAAYAFYGLAKFDLDAPYHHGDAPDYAVFTKYYGESLTALQAKTETLYDEKTGVTLFGDAGERPTAEAAKKYAARFALYDDVVFGSENRNYGWFAGTLPERFNAAPYENRLVGVAYSTWMFEAVSSRICWETPLVGDYTTMNSPRALEAHAALLYDADVDFVLVDWSNNVNYDFYAKQEYGTGRARNDLEIIEAGTTQMFGSWSSLEHSPNIAVFIGCPGESDAIGDGRLQRKADQVYREYLENETFANKYQTYLGKPLLVVYLGTPALAQSDLANLWNDDRFTVRFLTGYIGQQTMFDVTTRATKEPLWSWEERGQQCYAVRGRTVECMTVQSAWRAQSQKGEEGYIPAAGRNNGETLLKMWARARAFGPEIVFCPTWNEYSTGEQPTPEINKDLEPSNESGTFYYDIMKEQIKLFKNTGAAPDAP